MLKILFFISVLFVSFANAEDMKESERYKYASPKYGVLEVVKKNDIYADVLHNGVSLSKGVEDKFQQYASFHSVYHLKNSDVILLESSGGGSMSLSYYFFVEMKKDGNHVLSNSFMTFQQPSLMSFSNDVIVIDGGFEKGERRVFTYKKGLLKESVLHAKGMKMLNPDLCDDLYYIYYEFHESLKQDDCENSPIFALNGNAYRNFREISNQQGFNEDGFFSAVRTDCRKKKDGAVLTYDSFSEKACRKKY